MCCIKVIRNKAKQDNNKKKKTFMLKSAGLRCSDIEFS